MTVCTHDSLARGEVFLVMSNLELDQLALVTCVCITICSHDSLAADSVFLVMGKFGVILKWCSIWVRTHEILARLGRFPLQFYITKTRHTD